MPTRLAGLTKLTLETAPTVCHECIWWQSRGRREVDKDRWMERIELDFGAFGTVYYDGAGKVLGSMQYGPGAAFPRAYELPGGPPSDDAILVTCRRDAQAGPSVLDGDGAHPEPLGAAGASWARAVAMARSIRRSRGR